MKSESNVSIAYSTYGIWTNYLSITLLLLDSPYAINEERPSSSSTTTYVSFLSDIYIFLLCVRTHLFRKRKEKEILYLDDNDDDQDALHLTATGEVQQ